MTRLQKKCLVVSAGFHGLLVVLLLVTAAFRSEPTVTEEQILHFVSLPVQDRPGVGGVRVTAPAAAQPAPPAPAETHPQSESRNPPREIHLPAHSTEVSKPVARNTPRSADHKPATEKPAMERLTTRSAPPKHVVKVDLTSASSSVKTPSKDTDSAAESATSAQEERRKRAQDIADAFAALNSSVESKEPSAKVVPLPGLDGGEAFVNYRTAVFNAYYQAWKTPEDTTHKLAVADVKIVVSRNGDIISSEIISKSGDGAVDRSVQRALDAVKQLPPFPSSATDTERTFIIRFNLEAKESAG